MNRPSIVEKEYVQGAYQEIASEFDKKRSLKWDWIENFLKNYDLNKDQLYDLGCGGGRNLEGKMIGLDNCPQFIEICRQKGLSVELGDLTELPFDDQSADGIISIASFHHLDSEERRLKALLEMKRILKSNGKILLSIWSKDQPKKTKRNFNNYGTQMVPWKGKEKTIYRYYYIFKIDEINQLFEKAQLKVVSHSWECGNEVFILENSSNPSNT